MMLEKWVDIAKEVGAISDSGQEHSSSDMASQAIEILLGKGLMRDAVHYYVAGKPGSELLRGVLWQLHPYSAMEECYAIFKNSKKIQEKRDAIELLRVVADNRVLKWVPEFLEFKDAYVQTWAIGIIDQLTFSKICYEEDVAQILNKAENHENENVRERAKEIIEFLRREEEYGKVVQQYIADNEA